MQTCRQSRLEVGADFGVSLVVNLVTQVLFYGALATAGRSLTFAALVLGLAVPRRYVIRRLFNAAVAPGTRQSRWQSWIEVLTDTAVALVMAIVLQCLCYGAATTVTKAGGVTLTLYVITLGRRYALRRVFEAWQGPPGRATALWPALVFGAVIEHPALLLLPPYRGKISGRRRPLRHPEA